MAWDVFISHASEDKPNVARPLAEALASQNLRVWFDEFTLKLGNSLRRSIDEGLRASHFGIVILSRAFFQKQCAQAELNGLFAMDLAGRNVMLPIWHELDAAAVLSYSPMLADRVALSTSSATVVADLVEVIRQKAFARSECVTFLTGPCGFELPVVVDAVSKIRSLDEFAEVLICESGRYEVLPDLTMTFELPNARVGLNDARVTLGLGRLPSEIL
jgi:hypothetical protein